MIGSHSSSTGINPLPGLILNKNFDHLIMSWDAGTGTGSSDQWTGNDEFATPAATNGFDVNEFAASRDNGFSGGDGDGGDTNGGGFGGECYNCGETG
jgi:hypothetical protein